MGQFDFIISQAWHATAEVNSEQLAALDRDFHERLARAAGNGFLCEMLQTVDERLHFIRLMDITSTERLLKTCKQHLTILNHIKNGDVEAAKEALARNVEYGHDNVQSVVQAAFKKYNANNIPIALRAIE